MTTRHPTRQAFALIEAIFVLAVVAMLVAFAWASLHRARRLAQQSESISNLQRLGAMTGSYQGDFGTLLPAFSWTAGSSPSSFPDFVSATDDLQAAANQWVDIVRRRSPLVDFPRTAAFIPQVTYCHLVLADYAGLRLPDQVFASPGDRLRLGWQRTLVIDPPASPRYVFSSSYDFCPAGYYGGQTADGGSLTSISQTSWAYNAGSARLCQLRPRAASLLRFPAQKVLFHETVSRFTTATPVSFLFPEARVPILMNDLSASVRRSGDARQGEYTRVNGGRLNAYIDYTPSASVGEPPVPEGASSTVDARLRWTHRLLLGRDFGPAVP